MMSASRVALYVLLLWPVTALAGPPVESWQTTSGAKVMYVHAPDLPILDVRVVFDAGSARDADKPGLSTLTNALMTEGAGPWDADELAERLEDRGINLGRDALRDMAYISIRSLTDSETMAVALDSLAKILAEPRFDKADLERQRQAMLASLRRQQENPGSIASRDFYKLLYGGHPYAHDPLGDSASVAALTSGDVAGFHERFYVARNAVVAIVGDVDRSVAERIAEDLTIGLAEGEHAPVLPGVSEGTDRSARVEFDASQTHVRVGAPGMARQDPDYFALYVGNHILGGNGLVSTLSQEVREKRGLSYSVYSYFLPMRAPGPFLMGAQTRNDRADETLSVMRQALSRFIEEGPDREELDAAKRNLTGGFPLRVSSNKKIVEYIAMMGFYDYPLDYLDTFVDKVNAVSAEDVKRAFRARLDPSQLVVVTVGGA